MLLWREFRKAHFHDRIIGYGPVEKSVANRKILAIYTDNNLPQVGQKVG